MYNRVYTHNLQNWHQSQNTNKTNWNRKLCLFYIYIRNTSEQEDMSRWWSITNYWLRFNGLRPLLSDNILYIHTMIHTLIDSEIDRYDRICSNIVYRWCRQCFSVHQKLPLRVRIFSTLRTMCLAYVYLRSTGRWGLIRYTIDLPWPVVGWWMCEKGEGKGEGGGGKEAWRVGKGGREEGRE